MPRAEDIHNQILIKKGVSKNHIFFSDSPALTTIDEAEFVNRNFSGQKCNILIVTSPYHIKRTKIIFSDKVKNCRFKILGTPYEPFYEKWWTDQDSARDVILELLKILFYKMGGRYAQHSNLYPLIWYMA